jgi:hypothetical protein
MTGLLRTALIVSVLLTLAGTAARAQDATPRADNPSPELVSMLTEKLSITPEQAIGGAGSIFGLAKTKMPSDQFSKVATAVPGMDELLKAAPEAKAADAAAMPPAAAGPVGTMLPGGAAGLASLAGPFKSLGMSPETATKMVPLLTQFVSSRGGNDVGSMLAAALK